MAVIAPTLMTGPGQRAVVETTLTASNSFVYVPGAGQELILRNPTAGAISCVIDGADGTVVPVQGVGNVDVSGGYTVGSIPAGAVRYIPLDTIAAYLQGAVSITGSGLVAILMSK